METASRMPNTPSSEEMARLRTLVPLHTLPDDALSELLVDVDFEKLRKGQVLFEQGATDHENVYLLEGRVALLRDNAEVDVVTAGSETARFPLAHQLPRKQGARAKSAVRIVRIDSRRLSELLARTQTVDYQVDDLEDASEDDWMSMLLQSRVLQQVPASNIQRVMMRVEQVDVEKGEDLICQGDPGDFYYMLTSGRAVVRRDSGDGKGPTELATLGPGDAFGEEALLSESPRNSTVTMLHGGQVLRLSKEDFLGLIHNPLLDRIDRAAAQAKIEQGAVWLDLRSSQQYDESHLPNAINFPFESLRYQASSLAPDQHYVLYSNTGGRAMAGAFLLTERGFDVSVLDGGVRDEAIAEVAAAADPGTAMPAQVPVDDEAIQQRVHEAEARAAALEQRLQEAQRGQASVNAERQQHLQQVRLAVDQARRKLLETEQQKREAQAEREHAYAEMERLTSNLEAIEHERASLHDRMSEIEGLDKQLQARLAKAERDLIGERERAESAKSSLEELTEKLSEVADKREHEQEQHVRERGELKEELTALQMELEQANADLQDANERLEAGDAEQRDALEATQQRLASVEAQDTELQKQRDALQQQVDALSAQSDALQVEVNDLQARLTEREHLAADAEQAWQARLDDISRERDSLREQVGVLDEQAAAVSAETNARLAELEQTIAQAQAEQASAQAAHDQASATLAAERDSLQQALDQGQVEHAETVAQLQSAIDQLRADNEVLQKQLAAGSEEAVEAIEQAQARAAALDAELEAYRQRSAEELVTAKAALDAATDANAGLRTDLEAAAKERSVAVSEIESRLAETEGARADLEAQLTATQAQVADLEAARDAAIEEAETRRASDEARLADTDGRLAELRDQLTEMEHERTSLQSQLDAAGRQSDALTAQHTEQLEAAESDQRALREKLAAQQVDSEKQLQVAEADRQALTDERDTAQVALRELGQRFDELERAAAAGADEYTALQRQHDEIKAQLEASDQGTEAVVAQLREQAAQAAAERNTLQSQLEAAEQQIAMLAAQHAEQLATAESDQLALREQLAALQADSAGQLQAAEADQQALARERDDAQAALGELEQRLSEAEHAAAAGRDELAVLQRQHEELKTKLVASDQGIESAVAQLRSEKEELENRLEEKAQALQAAREEQGELIEALNTASAERETLQFELSERDDEQARLVDLENQVGEAIRSHERELLSHEQAQREWQEQIDQERAARLAVEAQLAEGGAAGKAVDRQSTAERDALLADLAVRDSEVEQLRGVIEEYVDQIRAAQSAGDDGSEVAALRAELSMVREQAIHDVAHMREQLAAAETQKRRLQEADGREAISLESMRQRIEELEASLGERQRELTSADEARHMLEDKLEDANRSLDGLRRELEHARVEADEALLTRREAESARDQLQEALLHLQEDVESVRTADLRDERLASNQRPISLDGGGSRWTAGLIGAALVLGGLEALSFLAGTGELFNALLRLSSQ